MVAAVDWPCSATSRTSVSISPGPCFAANTGPQSRIVESVPPRGTVGKTADQNWRRTLREAAARSIRGATIGELKRKFQIRSST